MRALLVCVALAAACGPKLVWHGRSPDRTREVRVVEHRGQYIVLDGARGPTYDGIAIGALAWAPDSKRLAYAAQRGGHWRLVVDRREGQPFDGISLLTFSRDSRRLAYAAQRGKQWHVVVDDRVGPAFDALLAGALVFSRDGRRLAYVAMRGGAHHAVIDGVVGPAFDGIGELAFSEDGAHVAYLARRGDRAHAVIDGVLGDGYSAIESLTLSPAGGRAGYLAKLGGRWQAIVDGIAGPSWDLAKGLAFSSDGAHVAYVARRTQGDAFVVLDGVEGTSYTGVRPVTLAFPHGGAQPMFVAQRDFSFFVVRDGVEGPTFDDVRAPVLSADGAHWAYVGTLGGREVPVLDGVEQAAERWIGDVVLAGARSAFVARRGPDVAVIVDGVEHRYDLVLEGTLAFDATGAHWGCIEGVRADEQFHVIVDGTRTVRVAIDEAIDLTTHTQAQGRPITENDRILRDWVVAEITRATR